MKVIFCPCGELSFPKKLIKEVFESEHYHKYFFNTRDLTTADIFNNSNHNTGETYYSLVGDYVTNIDVYLSIEMLHTNENSATGFVIKNNNIYYVNDTLIFDRNDQYIISLVQKYVCPFVGISEVPDNHLFVVIPINGREQVIHFPPNQVDINNMLQDQIKERIENTISMIE